MKKISIALIMIIFLLAVKANSLVVIDTTRIMNFALYYGKILMKLDEYKGKFADYLKYNRFFNYNFLNTIKALPEEIIGKLDDEEFRLIIEMMSKPGYFFNIAGKDTWIKLFRKVIDVTEKYESLSDDSVVKENRYYRLNDSWRKFQDKNLEREKEYLRDIQQRTDMFGDMRVIDTERGEMLNTIKELIKSSSNLDGHTGSQAKLIILLAQMEYEELIQTMEMMVLVRSAIEAGLKEEVMAIDYVKRRELLNLDRFKNSIELIKSIRK